MDNLTMVVPYYNGGRYIQRLLESLPDGLPVIVIDDHSDEPLQLDRDGTTVIRPDEKGFFSGAVNVGIDACKTDVLILNQDVWFENHEWMDLINAKRSHYAVMGDGVMDHPAWPNGYVQGTFMFIRRDAWEKTGPFNVEDYPLWGSTCEWQLRACRLGFEAEPFAAVLGMRHRQSTGVGPAIAEALRKWPGERRRFLRTPPEVSVIVPCYNYGHYLEDAINSLIGGPTCLGEREPQSFQSFEIIIVDDASTDGSREVVKSLADPFKGIRTVLLDENKGTPGAINAGIKASYGKHFTILSADDMLESWSLEKMYGIAVAHPEEVVYGDMQLFKQGEYLKVLKMREYDFDAALYKNPMPAGIMCPRQAWEEVGGYPERMIYGREDWAFCIALGIKGWCGHKITGLSGYLCRRELKNRSVRTQGKEWYQRFISQLMSLFPQIYEGERPVACCGGRSRKPRKRGRGAEAMAGKQLLGREGMRLLEYVGGNKGTGTFWGPETGAPYKFGNNKKDKIKNVDVRDYEPMLKTWKNRKAVFSVYVVPAPPPDLELSKEEESQIKGDLKAEAVIDATASAKRYAVQEGLDLSTVEGTGVRGRITKQDVLDAIAG